MARIYVSSTFVDLKEYRAEAIAALRQLGHEVVAMENYVADDRIPLDRCLADVQGCDLYVGIFGWRYGFAPPTDSNRVSIVEREYRQAEIKNIPRLIFMLEPSVPWNPAHMDAFTGASDAGARIRRFREGLEKERLVSFFSTPHELARLVTASVILNLDSAWLSPLQKGEALADAARVPLGLSLTPAITEAIRNLMQEVESVRVLEVDLREGRYWWSSRLFLVAALAAEFTSVRSLAFVGAERRFIGLACPWAVSNRIGRAFPELAEAYHKSPGSPVDHAVDLENAVLRRVERFSASLGQLPGGEKGLKRKVSRTALKHWLGSELVEEGIQIRQDRLGVLEAYRILDRTSPFVALLHEGKLQRVVDRAALATTIARSVLELQVRS